jgi:hypothetical protein
MEGVISAEMRRGLRIRGDGLGLLKGDEMVGFKCVPLPWGEQPLQTFLGRQIKKKQKQRSNKDQ